MDRNDIQYHGNSVLMALVDQVLKTLRLAVAGCRAVESRFLVAPRLVCRIFRQRHQLDGVKVILFQIRDQLVRKLRICEPSCGRVYFAVPFVLPAP